MEYVRQNNKGARISYARGQTLIEVLVALSILAVLSLSVFAAHLQAARWVEESRMLTQVSSLSCSLLETVRGKSGDKNWLIPEHSNWKRPEDLELDFSQPENFEIFIKIEPLQQSQHLQKVGVRAEWKCKNGPLRSLEIYSAVRKE